MNPKAIIPKEEDDMLALAEYLDRAGWLWNHCPNEGKRKPQYTQKLKRLGLKNGFPDVTIFDIPPYFPNLRGAVIELKRRKGGQTSPEQIEWLIKLQRLGWATAICHGIDEALQQLRFWGYLKD